MKEYIEIPQGVNFSINGNEFTASGKEGSIKKIFRSGAIKKTVDGNKILIETINDRKKSIAEARAIVKHIKNMVSGVNKKFVYKLRVVYSHFPITLAIKGKEFQVNNFVGEKKPRIAKIKDGVNVVIKGKDIIVSSVDKEAAGTVAGLMEKISVVKNRDRRTYQDGIYIIEKGVQDE